MADEFEQIAAELLLIVTMDTVGRTGIHAQGAVSHALHRLRSGIVDRHDLIIVAMRDQDRHVESLQVFGEIGFRERLDAVIRRREAGLHPVQPEVIDQPW